MRLTLLLALVAVGAMPMTVKYGGVALTLAYFAVLAATGMVIAAVQRGARLPAGRWQAAALALALTAAFAVLYPLAQSGLLGPGSDRDEALSIAIQALLDGRFPYGGRTYLGGPVTPLPGALLIGMPFHLLGAVAVQNVAVTLAVVLALGRTLRELPARWLLPGVVTLVNPGFMQDYVTGGDYAVNALYVGAALWGAVRAVDGGVPWRMAAAAALLGVAVCSRPVYGVAVVILAAHGWHRRGPAAGLGPGALAAGVALALALPFYLHDPAGFSPLHVTGKLPPGAWPLEVVLPVLAAVAAAVLCRRPLTPARLFTALAAGVGIMLVPAAAVMAWQGGGASLQAWTRPFTYALPAVLYGCAAVMVMRPLCSQRGSAL